MTAPTPSQPTAAEDHLTLTVHSMPRARVREDLEDGASRTFPSGVVSQALVVARSRGRLRMLLVLLACAAPVIASYFTYFVIRPEGRSNYATLIQPTLSWPVGAKLLDAQGNAVDPAMFRKRWTLVVMGSSTCDTDCEKRLYAQRQLREMLGRDRDRLEKVFLVLDDGAIKPELIQALNTAPTTQVMRADRAAVAAWMNVDGAALDHHLYVVDPMGEWMMKTPHDLNPSKFKRDLDRLLRASSSWNRAERP